MVADEEVIREAAMWAYNALDNFPEFGEETRVAIIDTAADKLAGDGYEFDHAYLKQYAKELCG